jgi:hypothetical protein
MNAEREESTTIMPLLPADVAFRSAANAAAAEFAKAPPYLSYRTNAVVDLPSLNKHQVIARQVETRTADDFAVLQDLPQGQRQYNHSFPLIPTFDALSYFYLQYNGNRHDAISYVKQVQPITFADPRLTSHADVIVTRLRYYHATYAPDSTDAVLHLLMDPLQTLTKDNSSAFYLHDVYISGATMLPTRVVYAGRDADFACDYTTIDNHWLVNHFTYRQTVHGPLRIGSVTFTVDGSFDNFGFPTTPADQRLATEPMHTPEP